MLLQPNELKQQLDNPNLLVVDLSNKESYLSSHIPKAVHLDYMDIVATRPPVMGLLPDAHHLSLTLSHIGFTPAHHVIAYDNESNARASRFLWTLEELGHERSSLLDGGLKSWLAEGYLISQALDIKVASNFHGYYQGNKAADREYILAHLYDPSVVILDTRSPAEYQGKDVRAKRGGHIPGAVNFEWIRAIDQDHGFRFKPKSELRLGLESLGITPDKEVICYCQTHQRSAHTFMVLKYLEYPRIKGYPGAWSEWGNDPDTPVEV